MLFVDCWLARDLCFLCGEKAVAGGGGGEGDSEEAGFVCTGEFKDWVCRASFEDLFVEVGLKFCFVDCFGCCDSHCGRVGGTSPVVFLVGRVGVKVVGSWAGKGVVGKR